MIQFARVAVLAFCVLSGPKLYAQEPDIEAMKRSLEAQIGVFQRLNELEQRVRVLEQKGGDPKAVVVTPPAQEAPPEGSGAVLTPAPELSKTAVCRCQGSNRGVCFCLQNRVPCKCHVSKGSVWNLNEQGRAVSKTGEYADPRKADSRGNATVARSNAPSGSAPPDDVPRQRADGKWWWKGPDGTWFGTASLTEGQTYVSGTSRFVYRGGKMAPEMGVVIQPSGHWERRCVGGVCRMYWVND